MQVWKKILKYGKKYGWRYTVKKVWHRFLIKYFLGKRYYPYHISGEERERQQSLCEKDGMPLVSILVPVYNTPEKYFREMLESVLDQTYSHWELCLADASEEGRIGKIAEEYCERDARIKCRHLGENEGISENSNQALEMAQGEYIALLDHDDLLHPSALYWSIKEILAQNVDFVYTDELSFIKKPSIVQSIHFKSDFHWESFRNNNYICHFSVFSRELVEKAGGFRREFDGAQDYDLFLRMAELTDQISHIPKVLYYWRLHSESSASGLMAKPYVTNAGREALQQHLDRMGIAGEVAERENLGPYYHIKYHIDYGIRILVLVENEGMKQFVRDDLKKTSYYVRVKDGKAEEYSAEKFDRVILIRSGYLPEKRGGEWLQEIIECLIEEENELVGVATYDRKGRYIQAGYCWNVGWYEKLCPLYQGVPIKDPAYMNRLLFRQNVGVVGGAVLGLSGELFHRWKEEIGEGIFEQKQWFGLSARVRGMGKECVLSPCVRWRYEGESIDEEKKVWLDDREMEQMGKDTCCHPDMKCFGKMYFLWKK